MDIYAGETITVQVRGTDPVTREIITDAAGTVNFYAPPKNPSVNPGDRTPDHTAVATFDPVSRFYLATASTTGWSGGTWWVQGALVGGANSYNAFTYYSFPLKA